ncbi:MAG TPA: hypothetical protein VLH56_13605 [Dissulfurispiraceae bacterium]|nr:hypothetical protein [Dissulfurispiraceae bacterium]
MNVKVFELKNKAAFAEGGEQIFGSQDTGSHACYLVYGVMKAGESGRRLKPGSGHEEMVLAVKGAFLVTGHYTGMLNEGSAFHLVGEETCFLENQGDAEAAYVLAGGHSSKGHH